MSTPIDKIKGVGPSTARFLIESGYKCAEDLAAGNEDALAKVHGFGPARAKLILKAARELCAGISAGPTPSTPLTAAPVTKEKGTVGEAKAEISPVIDRPSKKDTSKKKKKKKDGKKGKKEKKENKAKKLEKLKSKKKKKK